MDHNLPPERPEDIFARADLLYSQRQHLGRVSESLTLLRQAEPDCFDIEWRLARAAFFLGQESSFKDSALTFHAEGVEAGKRATGFREDRVEGHFWLAVNLALWSRIGPTLKVVGLVLAARQALRRAIEIDESYHAAGPLRVLAALQQHLPRIMGGGITAARQNFERALAIAPANTVTRTYFAQLLVEAGELERARAELELVLRAAPDPDWMFEIERDQRLARKLLTRELKSAPRR